MSLVFAGITPHSPVLVPSIGQEHLDRLKKTTGAIRTLEQELYASFPDTILIISPQGPVESEHFTIDINETYRCDLKEFGDFETKMSCKPDGEFIHALREHLEDEEIPVMLRSEEVMDHGIVVPLTHLTGHMKNFTIVPIYPSQHDLRSHFEFGKVIRETIHSTNRRIAVLASVGLSHRLTETAPGGFSPKAKGFDEKVQQLIASKNSAGFVNFDMELAKESGEAGLSVLTILMGILDRLHVEPEILSYEAPFGIGYLVTQYHLK